MKEPRKFHVLIVLTALLCLLPLWAAMATSGTVTASSLNIRAKASADSNVVGVFRQGDKVTIKETYGSWYKVTGNGKTGYVAKKYVKISSGSSSSSSSSSSKSSGSSNGTCAPGDNGDAVRKVQKRLINLGYLSGSADGDYGNMTKNAVKDFQRNNGLSVTGSVNSATLNKLNSSSAKKAGSTSSSSNGTCKPGDSGDAVRKVQKRLIALGYLSNGSADGSYGNQTKKAVTTFQKQNGLQQTGTVNSATLNKLNSSSAKKAGAATGSTQRLDWFNGGKNIIPKGATFKVKDIWTGKIFNVKRWSGYNHLDAEPLTRSDTNTMKSIYGHWSWKRRPILVKYNGRVYAASMNGMPHGTGTISGNGFDGHFCIHFYKSKTHGSGKVDAAHQNCVAIAMNYSW